MPHLCLSDSLCSTLHLAFSFFFFFNAPATTEIYTLSLHDALPISVSAYGQMATTDANGIFTLANVLVAPRSEEHTSELQSHVNLVCRLLLEKKKKTLKLTTAIGDMH